MISRYPKVFSVQKTVRIVGITTGMIQKTAMVTVITTDGIFHRRRETAAHTTNDDATLRNEPYAATEPGVPRW